MTLVGLCFVTLADLHARMRWVYMNFMLVLSCETRILSMVPATVKRVVAGFIRLYDFLSVLSEGMTFKFTVTDCFHLYRHSVASVKLEARSTCKLSISLVNKVNAGHFLNSVKGVVNNTGNLSLYPIDHLI